MEATAEGVARRRATEAAAIALEGRCLGSEAPRTALAHNARINNGFNRKNVSSQGLHQHCQAGCQQSNSGSSMQGSDAVKLGCVKLRKRDHIVEESTGSLDAAFKAGASEQGRRDMHKCAQSKGTIASDSLVQLPCLGFTLLHTYIKQLHMQHWAVS